MNDAGIGQLGEVHQRHGDDGLSPFLDDTVFQLAVYFEMKRPGAVRALRRDGGRQRFLS